MGKKKTNKKSSIIKVCIFILIIVLGFMGGFIGGFLADDLGITVNDNLKGIILESIFLIASITLVFMIQIVIHEAGHLVFGLLSGYEFISFRVGSFTIVKEDGKLVFKKFNIKGTGGQCLMMPKTDNYEEGHYILYNLGGILMNTIISGICALIYFTIDSNGYINAILVSFILTGVLIFITNGIPMKIAGIANDGYNVISVSKNKFMKYCFYTQLKATGLLYKGIRIKDMPIEWFYVKEGADLNNPLITALKIFEANCYHDKLEFDTAKKCYEDIIKTTPNIIKLYEYEINCELLFYEILNENVEKVNKIYTKDLKKYIKATNCYIGRKRLMYAYNLIILKNGKEADKLLSEFQKLKKTYPAKGDIYSEDEIINFIKNNYVKEVV